MSAPTAQTLIEQLPTLLRPEVAGTTKVTVQLELTGEDGGQWWVRVVDGQCSVGAGRAARPDTVLRATAADYVQIRLGHLDPVAAAMNGRLQITGGKYGLAIKFAKMFRPAGG